MNNISNRWLQHCILLFGPLLTVIDVFIVNIAIPSIKKSLLATDSEVELVIAAYIIGYASFLITGGRLGDYWGRKKMFMLGMFLFVVTSALCGIAKSPLLLILGRLLQGISGAIMTPQPLSYLQILFPEPKVRAKALGLVGFTLGIGSLLGQFLGGYFAELQVQIEGWRFIFFINLPIGLIALLATYQFIIETPINRQQKFDYLGVFLLSISLSGIVYPLTEGRELGWPLWSILILILAIIVFVYFIYYQKKLTDGHKNPLINIHLFQIKSFRIGILMVIFYFMTHTSFYLTSTIFLQSGLNMSSYQTGLLFVYSGILFVVSSLLSIRLVNKLGKLALQLGILLMIADLSLQTFFFTKEVSYETLLSLIALTGLAGGLIIPALLNFTLKEITPKFSGAAAGVYNTSQQMAASLGISVIAGIFFLTIAKTNDIPKAFHCSLIAQISSLIFAFIFSCFYKLSK